LLNASVGVQRAIGRLRRPRSIPVASARTVAVSLVAIPALRHRFRAAAGALDLASRLDRLVGRAMAVRPFRQARHSLISRVGHDRTVALVVAVILLGASVVSVATGRPAPATGGTTGPGSHVRIAIGGATEYDEIGAVTEANPRVDDFAFSPVQAIDDRVAADATSPDSATPNSASAAVPASETVAGPFLDDGTLLKPVAVNTTVADGRDLMKTYKVKPGDTLTGIASKFDVSMMTLWWANNLKSKDDLHLGQTLTIPPVSGLVLTVKASDTLASLATRYKVDEQEILDANKLEDRNLVVGQVLAIPGALGKAIPAPKPQPGRSGSGSSGGRGGSSRVPSVYTGGSMNWPVVGGGNYISQYFHYGHYGIDIAADYGSPVRASAGGTVIFAGWKSNGGGYQVWIAHGSGLYTTYNHMSAISVGSGQSVGKGQQVGRVGQSGHATGPHLHFEVWRGGVWSGGTRINPLAYL
jgi:murein DD-endopeptidase MepM/ murein hydrolase activator NlpD